MEVLVSEIAKMYEKYNVSKQDVMAINVAIADALTKSQLDVFDGCLEGIGDIKEHYNKYIINTRKRLGI